MKSSLVIVSAVAIAAIGAGAVFAALTFGNQPATKVVIEKPCGDRIFGHIASLTPQGDHSVLQFDPAWFTSGMTANTAAAEDGAVEPGQPVPNDNYVDHDSPSWNPATAIRRAPPPSLWIGAR